MAITTPPSPSQATPPAPSEATAPPPSQATPDASASPVPQYQVEVLVFANREFDPTEEHFSQELASNVIGTPDTLREAPVFDDSNFGPLAPLEPPPLDAPIADPMAFRFRMLRPEELQLGAEYRRLERLEAYAPLLHAGWVQPGLPEEQSRPFDLALVGALNPRGSVRVYLSRFLHVNLDLTYQAAAGAATTDSSSEVSELSEFNFAPRYQLVTERNVRSGELHYFDHPAFGVLVKITPLPAETGISGGRPAA